MVLKKYFRALIGIILVTLFSSCETRVQYNFKIYNFSDKNVVLESSNNHISMYIPAQSAKTMEYMSEVESFDPTDLIIEEPTELSVSFSDGKSFTYHKESQILDSLGKLINLPKRIVNSDTSIAFPVMGIKNILSKSEWKEICTDKKNKVCTYEFEITKECYSYAKEDGQADIEEEEEEEEEEEGEEEEEEEEEEEDEE